MPPQESLSLAALRALEKNPDLTQRQLARELGVSLGRTNYCVQALVSKGAATASNANSNLSPAVIGPHLDYKGTTLYGSGVIRFWQ